MLRSSFVVLGLAVLLPACIGDGRSDPQVPVISEPIPVQLLISDRAGDGIYLASLDEGLEGHWFAKLDSNGAARPGGLLVDGDRVLVAAFGNGQIIELDGTSGELMEVRYQDRRILEEPVAMARSGSTLWVLGNDTRNLVALDQSSEVVHDCGSDLLGSPHDMVLGPGDRLYVATTPQADSPSPVQVWSNGDTELVAGFGNEDLAEATAIAISADDEVLVADAIEGRIVRFDLQGERLGTLGEATLTHPTSMALRGDTIFVLDQGEIVVFDLASHEEARRYTLPSDLLQPRSIAIY